MESNLRYFQRRASQEEAAAFHAGHPRARQAHLAMAQEYEHLVRRLAADERELEAYPPAQAPADMNAARSETITALLTR